MEVCKEHYCEHCNSQCEYYCSDCKKLICIFCKQIGKHSNHCCCRSEQAVPSEVKSSADKIEKKIKQLSEGYLKIEGMDTSIHKQGGDIKREIDKHYDKVEQKLKEQRGNMATTTE